MRVNPYIAGNPISGGNGFFGRSDILREVMQVLRHPQHNAIVLYGQRRIGKTSVLYQLEQQLATTQEFTPVYFDLQDKADKPLSQVLAELAQKIAHVVGLAAPDTTLFDAEGEYFRQQFLPQAAAQRELVLLFDEFDVLDSPQQNQAGQAFFPYLRRWMADIKRVHFVFVIGRRPEDLSTNTIATFKGVRATRVSRLSPENAAKVVRQSEQNGSLDWSPEAVEQVWAWAQGHPYFTQLLCSVVWEKAHEDEMVVEPVSVDQVNNAVPKALQEGANAFVWIWDGLPPAERVVTAAMAEAQGEVITTDKLVEVLNQSGVRLIVRQLELAPETLAEWEVLQTTQSGYRFSVPMLREWVVKNRPLRRVKEELDRLDPLAEDLFRTGQRFYGLGQIEAAKAQLRQAIQVNPNHLKARLLLGQILLGSGGLNIPMEVPTTIGPSLETVEEAVKVLEETYQYDPDAARSELVRALLALSSRQDETPKLATLERILKIEPHQPIALAETEQICRVIRKRHLQTKVKTARQYEAKEQWDKATVIYQELLQEFPAEADWQTRLQQTETQAQLSKHYSEAVGSLETGDTVTTQRLLAKVIAVQPDYKEVARYLLRATKNVDIVVLQQNYAQEKKKHRAAQEQIDELQVELTITKDKLKKLEKLKTNFKPQVQRQLNLDLVERWLFSTLIWLPLFLVSQAINLKTLPISSDSPVTAYQWITPGLVLLWVFTGWLGNLNDSIAFVVAFVVAGGVALGVMFGVAGSAMFGMAFVVMGGVALGVMGGVMGGVAEGVARVVAESVAGGVALGAVFGVAEGVALRVALRVAEGVAEDMAFIVVFIVVFGVAGVVALGVALGVAEGVAEGVEKSIEAGQASWLTRGALLALVLAYAFIIWFAFLGGYKVWS